MTRVCLNFVWLAIGIAGLLVLAMADVGQAVQIDVSRKLAENSTVGVTTTTTTTTPKPPTNLNNSTKTPASPPTTLSNVTKESADTLEVQQRLPFRRPRTMDDSSYFCACDLTINLCDINCCCDIDCDDRAVAAFVCPGNLGNRMHSSCAAPTHALCVAESEETRWPSPFPDASTADADPPRHAYRFGDAVHFYPEPAAVAIESSQPLSISAALDGAPRCSVQQPLRFMADQSVGCRRSSEAHTNYVSRLRSQLMGSMMPATRQALSGSGSSQLAADFCSGEQVDAATNETRPNCVPLLLFECLVGGQIGEWRQACRLQRNDTDAADGDDDDEWPDSAGLSNHLISYDILHDFDRILNVSVYVVYEPRAQDADDDTDDWRQTDVRFVQPNETRQQHHKVSGNFGYQPGLPVIVSHLRPANASRNATDAADTADDVLDYFHPNASRSRLPHLRIPRVAVDGSCSLHDRETIEFNRDFHIKCSVPLRRRGTDGDAAPALTAQTNFTELCTRMQLHVFGFLLADVRHAFHNATNRTDGSSGPTLVSALGNPENRTDRWSVLRDAHAVEWPPVAGDAVRMSDDGDGDDDGGDAVRSFRCAQMVLSMSYEFATVRVRLANGRQQWTVHEASVRPGARVDVRFDAGDAADEWPVPVFVDGVFVDVTSASNVWSSSWSMILALIISLLVH